MRQPGIVHVGLPGQPHGHLAVLHRQFPLPRRQLLAIEVILLRGLGRVVKGQLRNLRRAQDENVGNLAFLRPDAGRIDQHELAEGMPRGRGEFGSQSAAH